jgi:hypothetical protein
VSGVFRELFVEVPTALLEAAVKQAQAKQAPPPPKLVSESLTSQLSRLITENWLGEYLCGRFAWRSVSTWREPADSLLMFGVVMSCGHKNQFSLGETHIEDTHPTRILDLITDKWERAQFRRRCYCVQVTP